MTLLQQLSRKDIFEQKDYKILSKLHSVLTTEGPQKPDVKVAIQLYSPDIKEDRLKSQLKALHSGKESLEKDLKSIVTYLKCLNHIEKEYFSEVIKVVKLNLLIPKTNAVSERNFSALQRVKTWLGTTTGKARLN